ncbi:Thiol-disulfide isomerase or thioredoxin [Flavobacterium swingsii]|jgi:thiol-disulfide isomerase/thioredoxin|uniref:Thiol-disulfide isomerase or thioredoxin n=1 Tax=Flavobacterium swingsii TaxID=498292 RepID=A0A1I0V7E3_9FLAO|nr:TlpA disulfide reductase family protein [Flavobacterium swingsii]SFA71466.1 Thiol-disulfide isomerase or thioredoxin [Flavobacterium swingsii]
MKKTILLLSVIILIIFCSNTKKEEFSKEALSNKLVTANGSETNLKKILKKHKGKTVVIEIWASWCSDCVKNMSNVKELQTAYPNTDFVFLSCDKTTEAWAKGIEKHELVGEHYLIPEGMKGAFAKSINLDWIPRYIIIDKTGKIALYKAIETDHEKVNTLLKSLN